MKFHVVLFFAVNFPLTEIKYSSEILHFQESGVFYMKHKIMTITYFGEYCLVKKQLKIPSSVGKLRNNCANKRFELPML